MRQTPALSQSEGLSGRLECTRYRFIINGPSARLWGSRGKCEIPDRDALEVSKLAILARLSATTANMLSAQHTYGSSHGRSRGGDLGCSAAWDGSPAMLRSWSGW